MAPRYQVWLKNTAGTRVALFDDWVSLKISRRINAPDKHTFIIDGLDSRISSFVLDAQLEVWRWDEAASPALVLYKEYEGFHRNYGERTLKSNQQVFISEGVGYEDLLDRRIVQNFYQSSESQKGPVAAETAMKEYADEQAGPGADIAPGGNRLFEDGRTTGLTIQADGATGGNWSGNKSYRNLLRVEQDIAEAANMWFRVVGTGAATFEFQAGVLPLGSDRTTTGLVAATGLNGAGNSPVILSNLLNTSRVPSYSKVRDQEGNRCLALGQGHGDNRNLRHVIIAPDPGADSPWNNREVKTQATDDSSDAALDDKAAKILSVSQARERFDFNVEQTDPYIYGRDYFLGDTITAVYKGIEANKTIVGVDITVQRKNGKLSETINLQLADVIATSILTDKGSIQSLTERIRELEAADGLSADGSTWDNVVVVAKNGGDFTTIAAALAAITDNAALNRYAIFLMPGLYSENVTMKSWVDIVGLDQRTCRIGSDAAGDCVTMAADSWISHVTIEEGAGGGTNGLVSGNIADAGAHNILIKDFPGAHLFVARGDYDNIRVYSAIANSDGLKVPAGGVRPIIRNSYFEVVDRAIDIADDCSCYNCEFIGARNVTTVDYTQFFAQDCTFNGSTQIFNGGGVLNNCWFEGTGTCQIAYESRVNYCEFNEEIVSVTASGSRFYGLTAMVSMTINIAGAGNTVQIRHCNRVDITAMTLTGAIQIDQCIVDDIAYTAGVHSLVLNGNTYAGTITTNANRTISGTDVVHAWFPISSLGTGTYQLHGTHVANELNGLNETCYAELYWPDDLIQLLDVFFRVIPTTTGTFDWTVDTTGGTNGEDEALHVDTDTANGEAVVDDQLKDVNCSAAFNLFNPEDSIGAEITLDGLAATTAINVLGFLVQYVRTS